ncbi:sodium channel regulatory subunit beta-3 [Polymixia lowei]
MNGLSTIFYAMPPSKVPNFPESLRPTFLPHTATGQRPSSMFTARLSQPVCVDVPSDTEAVLGKPMKLTCIACMKREEIRVVTRVDWYYLPNGKDDMPISIFQYRNGQALGVEGPWKKRLAWIGSTDLQDVSISITNVTYNDNGTYRCEVFRQFAFDYFTPSVTKTKDIHLKVKEKASQDATAVYSEVMMYVLLVFLTLWLLVEMVYCYRKISKSDEQAQDTATNYLAVPSEHKDNPAAPVTE